MARASNVRAESKLYTPFADIYKLLDMFLSSIMIRAAREWADSATVQHGGLCYYATSSLQDSVFGKL